MTMYYITIIISTNYFSSSYTHVNEDSFNAHAIVGEGLGRLDTSCLC